MKIVFSSNLNKLKLEIFSKQNHELRIGGVNITTTFSNFDFVVKEKIGIYDKKKKIHISYNINTKIIDSLTNNIIETIDENSIKISSNIPDSNLIISMLKDIITNENIENNNIKIVIKYLIDNNITDNDENEYDD